MFEAIAETDVEIAEGSAARRKASEDLSQIPRKGREHRVRRKAMKAAVAQMEPCRRIVGPAPAGVSAPRCVPETGRRVPHGRHHGRTGTGWT